MGMSHKQGRRALLLGGRTLEIRPPWALVGEEFFKKCSCCRQCLEGCPEKILATDRFGYPLVDFRAGECTFCGICAASCPAGALVNEGQEPWRHKAHIAGSCLNARSTLCRTCAEECESRAISYPWQEEGFALPLLELERCTGCGACLRVCPVQAITMILP